MYRRVASKLINTRASRVISTSARNCLKEGDSASVVRTITRGEVTQYADLVDDHNPVHLAEDHKGIVHGTHLLGLVSGKDKYVAVRKLAEFIDKSNLLTLKLNAKVSKKLL